MRYVSLGPILRDPSDNSEYIVLSVNRFNTPSRRLSKCSTKELRQFKYFVACEGIAQCIAHWFSLSEACTETINLPSADRDSGVLTDISLTFDTISTSFSVALRSRTVISTMFCDCP